MHQGDIISGGYGYAYQVNNLLVLLDTLGVDQAQFIEYLGLAMLSTKSGADMLKLVESYIAKNSSLTVSEHRVSELLTLIIHDNGFKPLLKNKLSY